MIFIPETGAGIAEATSYMSAEDADSHFLALGRSDWAAAPLGARQQALVQASLYVDSYAYPGAILSQEQGLKWPRAAAHDTEGRLITGLPHALRTAVLELAAQYLEEPPEALDGRTKTKEKIGALELVYSATKRQPSFVFRLLLQIGARPIVSNLGTLLMRC